MIPTKLTLRNFMSYGNEPTSLDFGGMHVACLSGDNGNGKSALLDAITYALWGKTRVSGSQASGEDDLVRLGAEDMEVTLEFRLGPDLYRSTRKRNRRTHSGEWQAQLRDSDGVWRPVGGTGMRETERGLVRILRMEYETFLNSAYLQQGRADEFTRQKPDARKRILADILNLRQYDRLEQLAKERKSGCDLAIKDLDGEIRHLEARAQAEAGYRQQLAEHEAALSKWTAERISREQALSALAAEQTLLDEKAARFTAIEARIRVETRELEETDRQIEVTLIRIKECDALLARRDAIERQLRTLRETQELLCRLEAHVNALHEARRARADAEGRLSLRKQELSSQLRGAEQEVAVIEERERAIRDLEVRLAEVGPKLEQLERGQAELETVRTDLQAAQQAFADLVARNDKSKAEIAEVEEVLTVLASPKPSCPVCQSDLSGGRQAALVGRLQDKQSSLKSTIAELKREGLACRQRRDALQARSQRLDSDLRGAAGLRGQQMEWRAALDRAAKLNGGAAAARELLCKLRVAWDAGAYGERERGELRDLDARIGSLGSVSAEYESARAVLKDLTANRVEVLHAQLVEAGTSRGQLASEHAQRLESRNRREALIQDEKRSLEALRLQIADRAAVRERVSAARKSLDEATESCDGSRSQVERFRHLLADCLEARQLAARKSADRTRVMTDRQAYIDLAAAFGKRGVQALIIDNALPEVQDEANRLLARITDNAMHVTLDTQRDKRGGGGQLETLDIRITDDAGIRPYEMFSGGEAFRVNFAIRIALSRLLARRAGARLQTLIIDEGFGTQDAKGRDRLVEAIESVQDEFDLILVITHIEELKDCFPTRIEIVKTASGSAISLQE